MSHVLERDHESVRTITLNCPETLNALTVGAMGELGSTLPAELAATLEQQLACFAPRDFAEGVRALAERRPPRFRREAGGAAHPTAAGRVRQCFRW